MISTCGRADDDISRQAKKELAKALHLCSLRNPHNARSVPWSRRYFPALMRFQDLRLIYIYLLTASLPLGTFPTLQGLHHFGLVEPYSPLISALKVFQSCPLSPVKSVLR